tara:strand:+ start:1105 stop:1479 length:375 start_codon:yes stop_codon:yes gene_type:complete
MPTAFVYGTLKRGGRYHDLLTEQKYLGEARTVAGYTLYQPADYPGMVRAENDTEGVTGELWEISQTCLAKLDALEGLTQKLYERIPVRLLAPHDSIAAESYLYLRPLIGSPHLGSTWQHLSTKS